MKTPQARLLLLAPLLFAALWLRFWQLGDMPLFGDEAYYLLWAERPAPMYYDHPAGVAALLMASTAVGGKSAFGVRWLNALLSAGCVSLAHTVGRRYVSEAGGWIAAAAAAFAPVCIITGRVVYPDALQAFLMLFNLSLLAPLLERNGASPGRLVCWSGFGLSLALLLNVKLSSGFYAIGLAVYVLARRRDLLRDRRLWLATGIALLGLAPIVGWNLANEWGTFRLALLQGQGFGLELTSRPGALPGALLHAWRYHTAPAALLAASAALAGTVTVLAHRSGRRLRCEARPVLLRSAPAQSAGAALLISVAASQILPVLLSRANSPRNLDIGLLMLWPLAGAAFDPVWQTMQKQQPGPDATAKPGGMSLSWRAAPARPLLVALALLLCGGVVLAGIGTAGALGGRPLSLPRSAAVSTILADGAGMVEFARTFCGTEQTQAECPQPPTGMILFAVDYNLAGQLHFHTGLPFYSSSGQFRHWGIPDFSDLTVFSLSFVPSQIITGRLWADFESVHGPVTWTDGQATVNVWQAQGRRVEVERVLDDLDYLALARAAAVAEEQSMVMTTSVIPRP